MASNWIGIVIGLVLLQQVIGALFVYPSCGQFDPTSVRIANGVNASPGSAPFMAYVMRNNVHICGGSIITHRYILTAAHCLDRNLSVRLGEYDDRTNPDCNGMMCLPKHEDYGIEKAAFHLQYNNVSLTNDIALLRLNRDIQFTSNIQPICLYQFPENVPRISDYTVYGWGLISAHGPISHVLQTTNLRRYYNRYCENTFRKLNRHQICAGSTTSDSCSGDSGGPLVAEIITNDGVDRFIQLGLVSFGHGRCIGTGVYTYVPNFGTWILAGMRILDQRHRDSVPNMY